MKKIIKVGILGLGLVMGSTLLSGCTQSFCSTNDKAHMMYMFDFGVSEYYNEIGTTEDNRQQVRGFPSLFVQANRPTDAQSGIGGTDVQANKNGYSLPTDEFFIQLDTVVLQHATVAYYNEHEETATDVTSFEDIPAEYATKIVSRTEANATNVSNIFVQDVLDQYGYLKFADTNSEKGNKILYNFDIYLEETRGLIASNVITLDDLPTTEYLKIYKSKLNSLITQYRSCIAITTDKYGYYGYGTTKDKTVIEKKDWGFAWKKGLFEGLLVYPIAWCVNSLSDAFSGLGHNGWPQLLAILIVTVVLRSLLLLVTGKQSSATAKMTALQPEIQKIQAKYPNSSSNQYEKQRMAEEMSRLYKKHKINPLGAFIPMLIQFPVFICVWGGLQGAASLSSDAFLGLYLSMPIRDALFNKAMWKTGGAVTALILFILLAGFQVFSMLLPQILQKKAAKKTAKLGVNPSKKSQDNKTKYFMIIMCVMIIFMSFTIASAMGFYWLVGSIFQIGQTLITTKIAEKRKQQKR